MAKSKEKKPHPKPPENAKTVIELKKVIEERKMKLAKAKEAATKEKKLNKLDPKYRVAIKRLKRAQRKLYAEAYRLRPRKPAPAPAAAATAPAEAAAPAAPAPAAAAAPAEAAAPAVPASAAAPAAAATPAAPAEGEKK